MNKPLPRNTRKVAKPSKEELERAIQAARDKYEKKAPHLHQEPSAKYRKNRN